MSEKTGINWTEATWNPLVGCSRVSEGCRHCYAEREAANRLRTSPKYQGLAVIGANGEPRWTGEVRLWEKALDQPKRWRKPRMIFVNSMSDLFHENVPDEWINRIFQVMRDCPQHTFQILTKRAERMYIYMSARFGPYGDKPLPNVWLGVSAENQATARDRIPHLLSCYAAVRWVSLEPLLGPVDLREFDNVETQEESDRCDLNWVVVGGESGPHYRPMQSEWVHRILIHCKDTNTAFFFKQWGGKTSKANGRLLGGVEWNEYPQLQSEGLL